MQRYSGGLEAPRDMVDVFTGKTTHAGSGDVSCELTYTPIDVDHIVIPPVVTDSTYRFLKIVTLVGNTLTLHVDKLKYYRASAATVSSNSGGAGADPHAHTIVSNYNNVAEISCLNEVQGPIKVHYVVA